MKLGLIVRNYIYRLLYILDQAFKRKANVLVLCYHSFDENGSWRYTVNTELFKKQLKYLKENNNFIIVNDLEDYLNKKTELPKGSVLITIDDGYSDNLKIVEILDQYKITPILFVLGNPGESNRKELDNNLAFLSEAQIKNLNLEMDWIIGSHTESHINLTETSIDIAKNEIILSKKKLESTYGECRYFSYPRGRYTKEIIQTVENAGFKLAFSMDDGLITEKTSKFSIPRIGIDASHSIDDFKHSISPTVIQFRQLVKFLIPVNFIERIIK